MDKNSDDTKKQFRFVKRRLSVHYSIMNNIDEKNFNFKGTSEENFSKKKILRRKSLVEQEENIKKLKLIYMKNKIGFTINEEQESPEYIEQEMDYSEVQNFFVGTYDEEFQKILHILISPYKKRSRTELNYLLSFLINNKISETLRTDILITDLTINKLFEIFKPYIFGKCFNFMDTIYYTGEEANNLYLVLYGSIGLYKLEIYEEELTCEEYFTFLSDSYNLYEEEIETGYILSQEDNPKKGYKIKLNSILQDTQNQENKNINKSGHKKEKEKSLDKRQEKNKSKIIDEDKTEQYIDHYLICQMIDENKDIYPLKDIGDLIRLKKIIFKLRLYMILSDSKVREAEILYNLYEYPLTYLNFNKVLEGIVPVSKYVEALSYNFKQYDYFYLKLLGPIKNKVKLMKYVKYSENLGPYSFFGNFELINLEAKRDLTVRCESDKCILLCIDKKMYTSVIYNSNKKQVDKEIESLHNCFLFRNIGRNYFAKKIFSNFQIGNLFKDNILFQQNEKLTRFIFVKEGILELTLQNMSFYEFHNLIKEIKELLTKKAKEYKMNIKEIFDFNTEVESKTIFNMKTIKGILYKKQNFVFQRNEKGIFGDYELFFGIPALLTCTIASEKSLLFFYDYDKYKKLNYDSYLLNESLKYNSFMKLKSLLKRMIMVYNSYWRLTLQQLTNILQEKEKMSNIINKEENEKFKKSVFNHINIRNNPFLNTIQLYKSNTKNNNSLNGLSSFGKYNFFHKVTENNCSHNNSKKNSFMNTNSHINNSFNDININISLQNNKFRNNITLYNKNNNSDFGKINKNIVTESSSQKKYDKNINKTNDNFSSRKTKNGIGKENIINLKIDHSGDYKKKLFKTFKLAMNAQHVANKKEKKKIFLPPINYPSQRIYEEILNSGSNTHKRNNKDNFEIETPIQLKHNQVCTTLKNCNTQYFNDSLNANNNNSAEKTLNKSESNDNNKKDNKKRHNLYNGVKIIIQKEPKNQIKLMKKNDLKFVQLYNLQIRKDKKNNSNDKSSNSFN